jgi:type VI secretion system protein ImpB
MAKTESLQHKLDRVRPPRVQITYDVQVGDAQIKKELPFVVGVVADLAGHPDPDRPLPDLKDERRKFVEINRDNFDKVLGGFDEEEKDEKGRPKLDQDGNPVVKVVGGIRPRLALKGVANKIENKSESLPVVLTFRTLEDFEPVNVVRQVEPLRKLLEARERLAELKSKITTNGRFNDLLQRIINDADQLKRLGRETGRVSGTTSKADTSSEPPTTRTAEEGQS